MGREVAIRSLLKVFDWWIGLPEEDQSRILKVLKEWSSGVVPKIQEKDPEKTIETRVKNLTNSIGIRPNILGYHYLQTAILIIHSDDNLKKAFVREVYPTVAKIHATTAARAERAMRHAIKDIFKHEITSTAKKLFGNDALFKEPTLSHFICACVEYLRSE